MGWTKRSRVYSSSILFCVFDVYGVCQAKQHTHFILLMERTWIGVPVRRAQYSNEKESSSRFKRESGFFSRCASSTMSARQLRGPEEKREENKKRGCTLTQNPAHLISFNISASCINSSYVVHSTLKRKTFLCQESRSGRASLRARKRGTINLFRLIILLPSSKLLNSCFWIIRRDSAIHTNTI